MSLAFATRNDRIVRELRPFLVATRFNRELMDLAPFGLSVPSRHLFDPLRMASAPFLQLLQRLDALTFGPEGMPMPRWVFFDGAELPGGIFGFGKRPDELSAAARAGMGIPAGYRGLVPYSMFIAIPMLEPGAWMGHNLASLNETFPEEGLSGLASITKAIALKAFRAETFFGVTQWRSMALHIHTKFGPLDLVTAYTPAHSEPRSLTYRFDVTDERLRAACGDPSISLIRPAATEELDADDEEGMRRIHAEVRAGVRWQVVRAPSREDDRVQVPLARF
jgi:hypothetical protein